MRTILGTTGVLIWLIAFLYAGIGFIHISFFHRDEYQAGRMMRVMGRASLPIALGFLIFVISRLLPG